MISKNTAKFIKSLQLKKYRKQEQCFLVEGRKSVLEVMESDFNVRLIAGTSDFCSSNDLSGNEVVQVTEKELSGLGTLKSNNQAIAVVEMKASKPFTIANDEYVIALDDINDPGNFGTILRIADWYGINKIIASESTADFYNPKVISASKGSFTRVDVFYGNLQEELKKLKLPVYGALLDGENVHQVRFNSGGVLVMGNEANGISAEVEALITSRVTIPAYGSAESLNVAMATAIICDNIKRSLSTPL